MIHEPTWRQVIKNLNWNFYFWQLISVRVDRGFVAELKKNSLWESKQISFFFFFLEDDINNSTETSVRIAYICINLNRKVRFSISTAHNAHKYACSCCLPFFIFVFLVTDLPASYYFHTAKFLSHLSCVCLECYEGKTFLSLPCNTMQTKEVIKNKIPSRVTAVHN